MQAVFFAVIVIGGMSSVMDYKTDMKMRLRFGIADTLFGVILIAAGAYAAINKEPIYLMTAIPVGSWFLGRGIYMIYTSQSPAHVALLAEKAYENQGCA
jgi:hypothetical protein